MQLTENRKNNLMQKTYLKIIFLSANSSEIWVYCIPALYDPTRMAHKMILHKEKKKLWG